MALASLALGAFVGPGWPLRACVFMLGVTNGAYAVAVERVNGSLVAITVYDWNNRIDEMTEAQRLLDIAVPKCLPCQEGECRAPRRQRRNNILNRNEAAVMPMRLITTK